MRGQRLKPVQGVFDDNERRLMQALAAAERKVTDAEAKLNELERYRSDYEQQFTHRAGRGINATDLRDYQAFLARLGEAIKQQKAIAQRARAERDSARLRWQDAAKRAKALGHVVEQWQSEERRTAERREQRETDERAQRKVSKP